VVVKSAVPGIVTGLLVFPAISRRHAE